MDLKPVETMIAHPPATSTGLSRGDTRAGACMRMGVGLIAATPVVMTFSREAGPVMAALAACAFIAAAVAHRGTDAVMAEFGTIGRGAVGLLLIAALSLMLLSVSWTPTPGRGALHALHMAGSVLVIGALVVGARMTRGLSTPPLAWIGIGFAVAALLVVINLATSSAVRAGIGLASEGFRLNRAAVALALLLPFVTGVVLMRGPRPWAMAAAMVAGPLAGAAIVLSDSSSAQLALLVVLIVWPLAALMPLAIHRLVALGIVLTFILTPFLIGHVNGVIPEAVHDRVGYASLTIRGEIWREFADIFWQRPVFGFGIEASYAIIRTAAVAGFSNIQKYLLNFGHPHNNVLQIYVEFGIVGAALALALIVILLRRMEDLPRSLLPAATATIAGVYAVALVSHGAWQAWWPCLIGLVATCFVLAGPAARAAPPMANREQVP